MTSFTYLDKEDNQLKFTVLDSIIVNNMSIVKDTKSFANDMKGINNNDQEITISLEDFTVESVNKFKEYLNGFKSHKSKYNYGDLELAKYLGYNEYILDLVVLLSENIDYALAETILEYKLIQYTNKEVIEYISKKALHMDEYYNILEKIFRNPTFKNKYIENTHDKMTQIIQKISSDDLIYMIKNFYAYDHYVATYVYIKLLEKALKICGPNLAQLFINFRDNSTLFCKNVYKTYNFDNNDNLKIISKVLLFGKMKTIKYNYYNEDLYRVYMQPSYLDFNRVIRSDLIIPEQRKIFGKYSKNINKNRNHILKINKCERCSQLYR